MLADMPEEIKVTLESLKRNDFDVRFTRTGAEAKAMMLDMIPLNARVGVADSVTLRQIGVLEALEQRGTEVINPFMPKLTQDIHKDPAKRRLFVETLRMTFGTDVFVTGTNAVTEDGKLVNIDGAGNRVAGIIYAAPKVILAIGRNKIVKDVDAAIDRIKNVLAPAHAKQKRYKTPCTVTGRCDDCNSPDRICNITVILEKKPYHTDLSVLIINEDLGLGWSPDWDFQRINEIRSNYYENSWPF